MGLRISTLTSSPGDSMYAELNKTMIFIVHSIIIIALQNSLVSVHSMIISYLNN